MCLCGWSRGQKTFFQLHVLQYECHLNFEVFLWLCSLKDKHMMDPLHPSFTPYTSVLQSALRLSPFFPPLPPTPFPILPLSPTPSTSHCIQCYLSADLVLLYPVYVCYIDILLISLTDEATIKPKRFI